MGTPTVLCPGQPIDNYCDCEGDCIWQPDWCACEEAQTCCKGAANFNDLWDDDDEDEDEEEGNVLCPGQPKDNYCDCEGDCTGHADWCACEEAQTCCEGASPTVLCPGQPVDNYCDCDGDCFEQPDWCACEEAQRCCNKTSSRVVITGASMISVGIVVVMFVVLLWHMRRNSKKGKGYELTEQN